MRRAPQSPPTTWRFIIALRLWARSASHTVDKYTDFKTIWANFQSFSERALLEPRAGRFVDPTTVGGHFALD